MEIIDGKLLSKEIKAEIETEVKKLLADGNKRPHLAAVLVGDDPASRFYVKSKVKSCQQVGFESSLFELPIDVTEEALLALVQQLNEDDDVDGFIVQLPLPAHIDEQKVTLTIDPSKDVDGFHPVNVGRMALNLPCYVPATPLGIMKMLERYEISTSGMHCVVIGRSNIVGTPISILLSRKAYPGNATVTLTHSRTADIADLCRQADMIVAAIGQPNFVTADMVKVGAVIIDVGINQVPAPDTKKGYRIVGDVDFEGVKEKVSYITPVPGGVGLMTVTSLLWNTLRAARKEVYA